ncbi:mas-related G-protein coupled receptor member H-like [Emydura macquarii macquarii]|uniref:mas-related G-protein coupled receptor member H-like n=1 Tax=Emydura macquarii macquarii TaxID=1129001 RepID=UPI00352B0B9B
MYEFLTMSGSWTKDENNWTRCQTDNLSTVITDGVTVIICLFGLVGNGIVLWFLSFHIKRTPFTVYILNLAAADFGFLLCLPGFLIAFNVKYFCFLLEGHTLINLFLLLSLLTYSTGLYLLTAISTERCLSVLYPIWHRCRRPKHLSVTVCALLWMLSFLLSGIVSSFCFADETEMCWDTLPPIYGLNFLIFAPILIVSNVILFVKIRCSSQRRQQGKLFTVILLTVLFFLIFAVPLSIQYFLDLVQQNLGNEISYLLASINSSINPIIYFLVGSYRQHRVRGFLKVALQNVFDEKADSREDREPSRQDSVEMSM